MKSRAKLKLVHDTPPKGPAISFIRRGRNPDLESPTKFIPTEKHSGDIVI